MELTSAVGYDHQKRTKTADHDEKVEEEGVNINFDSRRETLFKHFDYMWQHNKIYRLRTEIL